MGADPVPKRMTVDAFRLWLETQPECPRFELYEGEPMAMAPERLGHARAKARIWRSFESALLKAGSACEAIADGVAVKTSEWNEFQPDMLVTCSSGLDDGMTRIPDPVVVVEVLSPGTRRIDTTAKLEGYFRLPSLCHYLIVSTEKLYVVHHRRTAPDAPIATAILREGTLELAPPGIALPIASFFSREGESPTPTAG